ncbi:MAG TPA: DUF2155 domain-containing protein [Aestuariivirgaceae bacterium]|nr:DUF2155 domain-containing protein [Aestuariivirgaceae bacterium]
MRLALVIAGLLASLAVPAEAEAIRNPVALFAGLDKITGKITRFEAGIDEVTRFGSLDVRARVCNTQPATEQPKTTAFVEVEEALLDGGTTGVFTGWMLAESPGLNAVEHPVYDVWLTGCRKPEAPVLDQGDSLEKLLESLEIQKSGD